MNFKVRYKIWSLLNLVGVRQGVKKIFFTKIFFQKIRSLSEEKNELLHAKFGNGVEKIAHNDFHRLYFRRSANTG